MSTMFENLSRAAKKTADYWVEAAKVDFAIELSSVMRGKGVKQKDLAEVTGHSRGYISQVLSGDTNFTIESMVKLARALGSHVHIHLADDDREVRWIERERRQAEHKQTRSADVYRMDHTWRNFAPSTSEFRNITGECDAECAAA